MDNHPETFGKMRWGTAADVATYLDCIAIFASKYRGKCLGQGAKDSAECNIVCSAMSSPRFFFESKAVEACLRGLRSLQRKGNGCPCHTEEHVDVFKRSARFQCPRRTGFLLAATVTRAVGGGVGFLEACSVLSTVESRF